MRNECDRSERLDGNEEAPGGAEIDLSALAASAPPCAIRETDGASGRVDIGGLVRALHASDPGDPLRESRAATIDAAATADAGVAAPVALPVASGRAGAGRRTFASGAAVGGFVAAAIALTPLVANVAYAPTPITVTMLEPAPARGRVEHATVPVEPGTGTTVSGATVSGATISDATGAAVPGAAEPRAQGEGIVDDDPIAGLDPLDRIEALDPGAPAGGAPSGSAALAPAPSGLPAPSADSARAARAPSGRGGETAGARAALGAPEIGAATPPAPASDELPGTVAEDAPAPPGATIVATASPDVATASPEPAHAEQPAPATAALAAQPPPAPDPAPAAEPATAAEPAPAARPEPARGSASLDALLEGATPRDEATPAPAPRDADLPTTPSRDDVDRALEPVRGAVRACAQAAHGTASVRITVAGPTGRVTSAVVEGDLAGTPTGSCVARAVRGAEFRRFQRASFTVQYPFRI